MKNVLKIIKNKKFLLFLLFIVFTILSFFLDYYNKQNRQKINIISESPQIKLPYEDFVIQFTQSPEKFNCRIAKTTLPDWFIFSSNYRDYSIIISSNSVWPKVEKITFSIVCDRFSKDVSFFIKDEKELTNEELFRFEVKNNINTIKQREEYLKNHPYIQKFPIIRDDYMILFLEKQEVMYVAPKEGVFTLERQRQIEQKERPYVNQLGVPPSIPFVFRLED